MSAHCHDSHCTTSTASPAYRKALWVCLVANAVMFIVQIAASHFSHSVALFANSLDFLSDAANYGISIYVLRHTLAVRAKASIFKGLTLAIVGLWAAWETAQQAFAPVLPEPLIMTVVSLVALAVNVGCALLLFKYRDGDSNAKSVWLCSRNDALGNVAVLFAAGGVFAFANVWPDIIVAAILAVLAVTAAWQILRSAGQELNRGGVRH